MGWIEISVAEIFPFDFVMGKVSSSSQDFALD
jgi:hypothetical protein